MYFEISDLVTFTRLSEIELYGIFTNEISTVSLVFKNSFLPSNAFEFNPDNTRVK